MKDVIHIQCPECKTLTPTETREQDGISLGMEWDITTAPPQIAALIHGEQFYCKKCQYGARIEVLLTYCFSR